MGSSTCMLWMRPLYNTFLVTYMAQKGEKHLSVGSGCYKGAEQLLL